MMAEKRSSAKDLRALSETDLHAQLDTLRSELWTSRMKAKDGALQHGHQLRGARRQIARVQTIVGERQRHATQPVKGNA